MGEGGGVPSEAREAGSDLSRGEVGTKRGEMQEARSIDSQRRAPPWCDSVGHYRRLRESSFSSVTVFSVCLFWGCCFFFSVSFAISPLSVFFGSICITLRYACVATNESPVRRSEAACQHNFPPRSLTRGNLSHTNWEQRRYSPKKYRHCLSFQDSSHERKIPCGFLERSQSQTVQ